MKLVFPRYATGRLLNDLSGDMNAIFESLLADSNSKPTGATGFVPPMDVIETESSYRLMLDLPGISLENIHLDLEQDQMVVSGRRESFAGREKDCHYSRFERPYGEFRRVVRLPKTIDRDHVSATYDAGVLEIVLPKSKVATSRKIEIISGASAPGLEGKQYAQAQPAVESARGCCETGSGGCSEGANHSEAIES